MIKSGKVENLRSMPAGTVSRVIFVALAVLSALVFGSFIFIGYGSYDADTGLVAPMLTDVLLWFIYILVFIAVAVSVCAAVRSVCLYRSSAKVSGGVPSGKIVCGVAALLCVSFPVTFVLGSSDTLMVNGTEFTDAFLLRLSDMFIYTSMIFLTVAVAAVIYGMSGHSRRIKRDR
ncbi:hypothetical protein [Xylanibacter muris]|uniref:Uncharacterized protein n=1 Tax=Xylanibacter muris TaxID=2736290 RepID=A0ABX2APL9_9BACT|nr:hypothetical protein [Xylanibacter muris]NPD93186.1 hypothetical protein [Xylanibacter muris]